MLGFFRLMFDPLENVVYDYIGGVEDIKNSKVGKSYHSLYRNHLAKALTSLVILQVRTVSAAKLSFIEDKG